MPGPIQQVGDGGSVKSSTGVYHPGRLRGGTLSPSRPAPPIAWLSRTPMQAVSTSSCGRSSPGRACVAGVNGPRGLVPLTRQIARPRRHAIHDAVGAIGMPVDSLLCGLEAVPARDRTARVNGGKQWTLLSWARRYQVEHAQPVSRGGTDAPDNLRLACEECNRHKGVLTEAEFLAVLGGRQRLLHFRAIWCDAG